MWAFLNLSCNIFYEIELLNFSIFVDKISVPLSCKQVLIMFLTSTISCLTDLSSFGSSLTVLVVLTLAPLREEELFGFSSLNFLWLIVSFLVTKMFETFSSVLERLERAESKSALELTLDSNPCLLFFKFGKDDLTFKMTHKLSVEPLIMSMLIVKQFREYINYGHSIDLWRSPSAQLCYVI